MSEKRAKRKLTAILSADVKGYSRLMGEDELGTVETLKNCRVVIGDLVMDYRGRVIDSPGDNILSEFSSVVHAVECGIKIQEALKRKNEALPENRRMHFRIGINLGDVLEDEGRIYGDGVNVAARVESLAEAGGVCISGTVFDQVEGKLELEFEYLGEQSVKNIKKPIRVYRVGKGEEIPDVKMNLEVSLADKPSIAVLPFTNMSADPEQAYFADGLSEDLITDLSKIPNLLVISRLSSFSFKGKNIKVQQIAEELAVRYVLEGSVRKVEKRVRINAQLVDAISGHHLWADRYDSDLKDIFSLQDKITRKIAESLAIRLTKDDKNHRPQKGTQIMEAYEAYLCGSTIADSLRDDPEKFAASIPWFEKAIKLDPDYNRAYAALAETYIYGSGFGIENRLGISSRVAFMRGINYLQIAMKNPTYVAYRIASRLYTYRGQHQKALDFGMRAINLAPNEYRSNGFMALNMISAGRPDDKGTQGWPAAMKKVRFVMTLFSIGDLKVAERFADGFVKAGLPGKPSGFYKISQENRLTEKEIEKLFFGRKVSGSTLATGKQWRIERGKDGKAIIRDGERSDAGKSWVEEDMLCDQWDNFYEGLKDCWVVYRNPEGTPKSHDEYFGVPGYGIFPFSPVE